MLVADPLFKRPDYKEEVESDNLKHVFLKSRFFTKYTGSYIKPKEENRENTIVVKQNKQDLQSLQRLLTKIIIKMLKCDYKIRIDVKENINKNIKIY